MKPLYFLPKYITEEVVDTALIAATATFFGTPEMAAVLRKEFIAIAIVVPARVPQTWATVPYLFRSQYLGDTSTKPGHDYLTFAESKAFQLSEARNDDRTDVVPHLLMPGDAPLWGGVKRDGIVVACSSLKPWLDKAFAGVVADLIIGLSYEAYMNSPEAKERTCIIS